MARPKPANAILQQNINKMNTNPNDIEIGYLNDENIFLKM